MTVEELVALTAEAWPGRTVGVTRYLQRRADGGLYETVAVHVHVAGGTAVERTLEATSFDVAVVLERAAELLRTGTWRVTPCGCPGCAVHAAPGAAR